MKSAYLQAVLYTYRSITLISFVLLFCSFTVDRFEKSEGEKEREKKQSEKIIDLKLKALECIKQFPHKSLEYYNEALKISREIKDESQESCILSDLAMVYEKQGLYDKASEYYCMVLIISEKNNNKEAIAWSYINIGNVFFAKEEFDKASKYYNDAINIFHSIDHFYGIATSCNNVGLSFNEKNIPDSALVYFNKALTIRSNYGNKGHIALSYRYIGNTYKQIGDFESAAHYFIKAENLCKEANDIKGLATVYILRGQLFREQKDFSRAVDLHEKAVGLFEQDSDQLGLVKASEELALDYYEKGDYDQAIRIAGEVQNIAFNNSILPSQASSFQLLYKSYLAKDNYKKALEYFEKYAQINDSLKGQDVAEKFRKMEFGILSQKIEKKIEMLEKDKEIGTLIAQKRMNLIYYFIVSSLILLAIVLSNLRSFNYKVKLTARFSFEGSILSKILISLLTGVYISLFLIFTRPFGLQEPFYPCGLILYVALGIVSMVVMQINYIVFYFFERVFQNEKWENSKHILYMLSVVLGITFTGWIGLKILGVSGFEDVSFSYFLLLIVSVLLIPVFVTVLFIEKIYLKKHMHTAKVISHHLKNIEEPLQDKLITIRSDKTKESKDLLLSELICIEAKGNYSDISYWQNNALKKKLMLISLKEISSQLEGCEKVIRCHKSFIVNMRRVVRVSGNSQGYKLHMRDLDLKVPVSRNFPKEILESIQQKN